MLPHSYSCLLSYLIWGCHFLHTILIFTTFWISPALWRFFVIFAKIATLHEAWPFFAIWTKFVIFPIQICHFRQNHHSPTSLFWHPNGIASPLAIFCHFPQNHHNRQNRHSPRGHFWHPNGLGSPLARFCHFCHCVRFGDISDLVKYRPYFQNWLG